MWKTLSNPYRIRPRGIYTIVNKKKNYPDKRLIHFILGKVKEYPWNKLNHYDAEFLLRITDMIRSKLVILSQAVIPKHQQSVPFASAQGAISIP